VFVFHLGRLPAADDDDLYRDKKVVVVDDDTPEPSLRKEEWNREA